MGFSAQTITKILNFSSFFFSCAFKLSTFLRARIVGRLRSPTLNQLILMSFPIININNSILYHIFEVPYLFYDVSSVIISNISIWYLSSSPNDGT